MRKYCIVSDIHWCPYSSVVRKRGDKYSMRLENLINSMNWAEQLAIDNNCDEFSVLGDTFDRSSAGAEELTAINEIKFANIKHNFLIGNHEASTADLSYSTTSIFESIGANVINKPLRVEVNDLVDIYYIPYILTDRVLDLKDYIIDNSKKKIIMAHQDLAGIQYGRFVSQTGFDVDDICRNCNLFLDGHLHNSYVIKDKIVLVGNLTGQNFNENALQYDHYAFILTVNDDGSIELEPHINPYAFNFYKLFINTQDDINQLYKLKNNAVVSITCAPELIDKVEQITTTLSNVVEYRIVFGQYQNADNQFIDTDNFKVEDHLKQFINFVQTRLEPSDALTDELVKLGGD